MLRAAFLPSCVFVCLAGLCLGRHGAPALLASSAPRMSPSPSAEHMIGPSFLEHGDTPQEERAALLDRPASSFHLTPDMLGASLPQESDDVRALQEIVTLLTSNLSAAWCRNHSALILEGSCLALYVESIAEHTLKDLLNPTALTASPFCYFTPCADMLIPYVASSYEEVAAQLTTVGESVRLILKTLLDHPSDFLLPAPPPEKGSLTLLHPATHLSPAQVRSVTDTLSFLESCTVQWQSHTNQQSALESNTVFSLQDLKTHHASPWPRCLSELHPMLATFGRKALQERTNLVNTYAWDG